MPRVGNDAQALAAVGARVRIQELESEIADLRKRFGITGSTHGIIFVGGKGASAAPAPKRRKMSAKARKAISDAQKARRAKQRKAEK